jgi:hypothetical protein
VAPTLTLLHTAEVHVATFGALLKRLAPELEARHLVRPDLLDLARSDGIAAAEAPLADALRGAAASDLILCTCSTLGGLAEALGPELGLATLRVDRPMAERAVALGPRVTVVAALESTLAPTAALIEGVAVGAGREIALTVSLCEGAWRRFEAGDAAGYAAEVARCLEALAPGADVLVLAQASMAAAATVARVSVPVLSSPELGVAGTLARLDPAREGR